MDYFLYRIIIYIHVISSIASIGPFFLLLSTVNKLRSAREEEIRPYLELFKFAVWLVKHAGHVLVVSGILLVYFGPWTWRTPWLIMTLVVLAASAVFLARAFSPTLRKFDDKEQDKDLLISKLKRTVWIYLLLLLIMLWFMVVKPVLW